MGEWSKKIGEHGEDISNRLLDIIGWKTPQKGIDIPCIKGNEHKQGKGNRKTHGMDFLHYHKSPLFNHTLQFACISSKCKGDGYPSNPIKDFKDHLRDLETLIDCFSVSELCRGIKNQTTGVNRTQFAGVLIWLHDTTSSDAYDDLLSKVDSIRFSGELEINHPIYLIDNKQANFLFDCHIYMTISFPTENKSFFYQKSGNNNSSDKSHKSSGSILPIEMITSQTLIYKAENDNSDTTIAFITQDTFSLPSLKKLIGLAHDITSNLPSKIQICFPDYNKLRHSNDVENVKSGFEDNSFISRISVHNYNPSPKNS